ncbi:MAG TPA: GGDEF domain-containing protein [Cellvibrio sp.]|nr:GGDEF domain-containing protein [Cellvibrio sp.]
MTDKNFNTVLLLAILITLLAVIAQKYFPQKQLSVWPNNYIYYFYSSGESTGKPNAYWLDQEKGLWRCNRPEDDQTQYFICSFNAIFFPDQKERGLDLRGYTHLKIKLKFWGTAKKLRISLRNFDPAYSKVDDSGSSKFQSVILHTKDLENEVNISLSEFVVADWWLSQYDIPRALSAPDMSNVATMGMDYVEQLEPGNQDIQVESIELVGGWISAENWYLAILGCWMVGIFIFAVTRLIQLQAQTKHDVHIINSLNRSNAELQEEKDRFRRLSTVDPLTQAYNRFGIDQIVSTLMICSVERDHNQYAPNFALIVLDIDFFKHINDQRGHDAGDRVLQEISQIVNKAIRPQDFLGRWGGEEFVVILPSTTKEFALALAEKIRLTIYDTVFEPANPLAVTASFGVSDKLVEEDFATTFKRADCALYAAKSRGRNCCVLAEDELVPAPV